MPEVIRKRGLDAEAAARRWSDPAAYAEFAELSDVAVQHTDEPHSLARLKRRSYLRNALIEMFMIKLQSGDLLASAIPKYGDRRVIIHPSLWDDLFIIFPTSEISRGGVIYTKAEFFEPTDVPGNIYPVPEWLAKPVPYFSLEGSDYRHVCLDGETIHLGDQQIKVIAFLHKKALENEPWQSLRSIQDGAKVMSKIQDLFGQPWHWLKLLRSDAKGYYRLRDQPSRTVREEN